jgi:hypothetical protein
VSVPRLGPTRPVAEAICVRITGPDMVADVCGRRATWHFIWGDEDADWAVACDEHMAEALTKWSVLDRHTFGGVCNMPGTWWDHTTDPSRCIWEVDEDTHAMDLASEPQPAGRPAWLQQPA